MTRTGCNPIIRLLPSLTDAAFVMPLVLLYGAMGGTKTMLGDGDTGWHVRTGEWILQNGRVPDKDIFSFTKPGEPWFAWEWLWDVIFGWLHLHWGMAAVVLASSLVLSLTFALLFRVVRNRCGNEIIAIAVTLLAALGSSLHWLARPHLFTLLFVVIFVSILERTREGSLRWLIALPFLTVLWTNLHGGFLAGIILLGAYAAGDLAAWAIDAGQENRSRALKRARAYLAAAAACGIASLANPYGYLLHVHIFHYLTDSFQFNHINEFLPTEFRGPLALAWEAMLLLGAIGALNAARRREFVPAAVFLGWAHMALYSRRNIPLYLLAISPLAAVTLRDFVDVLRKGEVAGWIRSAAERFGALAEEFGAADRIGRVHVVNAVPAVLLGALFFAPAPPREFHAEYDAKRYPAAALASLEKQGAGRIFADDEWGDYLIYRLYPAGGKVFVDGRSDFYGNKFDQEYLDVMGVKYDWERTLGKHGIDVALLRVDMPLASSLKESPRWRVVYDDGMAIAFRNESIVRTRSGADRGQSTAGSEVVAVTQSHTYRRR